MALSDYQDLVSNSVRDDSGEIDADQIDQAIALAVIRYSTDRPRTRIEAVEGFGSDHLPLPEGWVEGFSNLRALALNGTHTLQGSDELTLSGRVIICDNTVSTGSSVHVEYSAPHVLTEAEDTIPLADQEAVAAWASNICMEQLASFYAGSQHTTIEADSVDWQGKRHDYERRAKRYRDLYQDHMGIDRKRNVAASVTVDLDRMDSRGRDRLLHSQRRR